jgi:hypothetical protein
MNLHSWLKGREFSSLGSTFVTGAGNFQNGHPSPQVDHEIEKHLDRGGQLLICGRCLLQLLAHFVQLLLGVGRRFFQLLLEQQSQVFIRPRFVLENDTKDSNP